MRLRLKNGGFTLLEVLIALAIFSVMSMMAYGGLKTLLNARNGTEQAAIRLNEIQMAFLLIQQDMEYMAPRSVRVGYGTEPAYAGDSELEYLIAFTRGGNSTPRRSGRSGLYRVAYQREEEQLIRLVWPTLDRVDSSVPQKMVLLNGVADINFESEIKSDSVDSEMAIQTIIQEGGPPTTEIADTLPRAVEMMVRLEDWGTITRIFAMPF